eukprot:758411-Pleurochrysis_carterae.AAC.1
MSLLSPWRRGCEWAPSEFVNLPTRLKHSHSGVLALMVTFLARALRECSCHRFVALAPVEVRQADLAVDGDCFGGLQRRCWCLSRKARERDKVLMGGEGDCKEVGKHRPSATRRAAVKAPRRTQSRRGSRVRAHARACVRA